MFFNQNLFIDGSLKDAWRIAHKDNALEADGEVALPEMCEQLLTRINNDYRDRHRCLSLRSAGFLTSGLARLYRRKVQRAYEDLSKLNKDMSHTSESEDENEDDRIKRETSLLSLRKRRRPITSDERETIRRYITDEDRSSHSSKKIRSRGSLSNPNDKSSTDDDEEIVEDDKEVVDDDEEVVDDDEEVVDDDEEVVDDDEELVNDDEKLVDDDEELVDDDEEQADDDEELVDDEFASNDRNVADNSNKSSSVRSHISEKSFVSMSNKTVPENVGQQTNAELKCIENDSHVDDKRVEGAYSRNKSPMVIDDVVQSTTIRDSHKEVSGCNQSTDDHDVSVARTNNNQPTGAAQEKQKSQTTQTTLSHLNRLRGDIIEDFEGVNFRTDLPFGCLHVYDSYHSRVPTKIILTSLNENIRKLK